MYLLSFYVLYSVKTMINSSMELNRIWHEPVVEIYGNLITPGVRCSAQAYDLGNRRWYQLNVDRVVTDDDWMSTITAKHISEHYQRNQTQPFWNAINVTSADDKVSFEAKPDDRVVRPIRKKLNYGTSPTDKLLIIRFDEVKEKTYLSRGADSCTWNGRKCVFKRIEFDVDIESLGREIRTREALIDCMKREVDGQDYESEMERRFNVVPIIAVVQLGNDQPEQQQNTSISGFPMPFTGDSLEIIAETSPFAQLSITTLQL